MANSGAIGGLSDDIKQDSSENLNVSPDNAGADESKSELHIVIREADAAPVTEMKRNPVERHHRPISEILLNQERLWRYVNVAVNGRCSSLLADEELKAEFDRAYEFIMAKAGFPLNSEPNNLIAHIQWVIYKENFVEQIAASDTLQKKVSLAIQAFILCQQILAVAKEKNFTAREDTREIIDRVKNAVKHWVLIPCTGNGPLWEVLVDAKAAQDWQKGKSCCKDGSGCSNGAVITGGIAMVGTGIGLLTLIPDAAGIAWLSLMIVIGILLLKKKFTQATAECSIARNLAKISPLFSSYPWPGTSFTTQPFAPSQVVSLPPDEETITLEQQPVVMRL